MGAIAPYTATDDGITYLAGTSLARINDGNISTAGNDDLQVHPTNATGKTITMTFASPVNIAQAIFYNRTGCCRDRIAQAQMLFKNSSGATVFTFTFPGTASSSSTLATEFVISNPAGLIAGVKTVELTNFQLNDQNFREIVFLSSLPGGVAGDLDLWLKADAGLDEANGAAIDSWADQSGAFVNVAQGTAANRPDFLSNAINFNPAVDFAGGNQPAAEQLIGTLPADFADNQEHTIYAVFVEDVLNDSSNLFAVGAPNNRQVIAYHPNEFAGGNDKFYYNFNFDLDTGFAATVNRWFLDVFKFDELSAASNQTTVRSNGAQIGIRTAATDLEIAANSTFSVGAYSARAGAAGSGIDGKIAEFIIYSVANSEADNRKVESYLSLKYGITLSQAGAGVDDGDYLASNGSTMWDKSAAASGFNNDIFGIGRDDRNGLNQRVSRSVESDDILTVSLDGNFTLPNNSSARLVTHDKNLQFLTFANNNGATTTQTTGILAPYVNRVTRLWQLQKTNFEQSISFKVSGFDDDQVLVAKTADSDFSSGIIELGFLNGDGEITLTATAAKLLTTGSYLGVATASAAQRSAHTAALAAVYTASASDGNTSNGSAITLAQFSNIKGVVNVSAARLAQYQAAIASTSTFSATVTIAQLQSIIDRVNESAPGGQRENLSLWLKADANVANTGNGTNITAWNDQASGGNNATTVTGTPTYVSSGVNFYPAVDFDANDQISGAAGFSATQYYVVFDADAAVTSSTAPAQSPLGFTLSGANGNESGLLLGDTGALLANEVLSEVYRTTGYRSGLSNTALASIGDRPQFIGKRYDAAQTGIARHIFSTNGKSTNANLSNDLASYSVENNRPFTVGGTPSGSNDFSGTISEVVSFSALSSAADRLKIESYLALKYGITLDQSTATNYVASNGTTVVWDASVAAAYNNNIVGIGRDINSGLNQQISKSANSGSILTLSTDSNFSNANGSHATIVEGHFLVLGNNNAAVDYRTTEVPFSATNNVALQREWLVKRTGTISSVVMKFDGFDDGWTLYADSDGNFATGARTIGKLNANGEITVPLGINGTTQVGNGDYITLARFQPSPGGVGFNKTLWLKADAGTSTTTEGGAVTSWKNAFVNSIAEVAQSTTTKQPAYKLNEGLSFNPVVDFDGGDLLSNAIPAISDTNEVYAFVVSVEDVRSNGAVFGLTTTASAPGGFLLQFPAADSEIKWYANNLVSNGLSFSAGDAAIASVYRNTALALANQVVRLNSESLASTNTNTNNSQGSHTVVGALEPASVAGFNGRIGETILIDAVLSEAELVRVESYLALKWGIAKAAVFNFPNFLTPNYTASNGTVFWTATGATAFYRDIFGIGRDDTSGLGQVKAKSASTDAIITLLAEGESDNDSNAAANYDFTDLSDREFFVVANNNGSATFATTGAPAGSYRILNRRWRVQETGDVGNVQIDFDVADAQFNVPDFSGTNGYVLVYDSDNDGVLTDETVLTGIVALTQTAPLSNIWRRTGLNLANGTIFSIGYLDNLEIISNYATANTNPAPTVANYNAAGASAVNAGNLARVNTVVDSLTATDVNTLAKLQVVVNYAIKGAPGGVFLNNALWLKADAGVTTSGASDVDSWVGQSLKATSYSASTATGVAKNTLAASAINFNPAVRLAGGATPSLSATDVAYNNWIYYIVADPDNVTFASNFHGNNDLQLAYEAFNNTSKLGVTVRSAGTLPAKGDYVSTVDSPTVPAIMRYRHDSTSNNIDIESTANAVKQTGALNTNSTNRPLGVQQFGELFSGDIAEVFMLEVNAVTATETQRIESYLALKYGITLAQATNTNYLSSTGNMWVNDDDGYENDIVGIGKDINSALDQRIAKSVNSDAVLTISTDANFTGANNTHADNLDNGDFLVIANNHAATDATATQTTEINTSLTQNLRLVREWKADNVGSVGAVNLQFSGFNADWVLLSDTDGDFSNATVVGSLSATGTISTTLANNSYFTLARFDALVKIGADEDNTSTTSTITAAQINAISGVSGALAANEAAYRNYIDANDGNFDNPATAAQVQAMVTSVNAAQTLLAAIGTDENDGAATTTNPTAAQLNAITGVSGATVANQAAYQAYISANENNFSSPATAAEVQAMITSVNAAQTLLAAIGTDEGDGAATTTNPTAAQLNAIIGVSGATAANQAAYQAYINANENNFSSPATAAEVQAMITSVNAAQTLLAAIGTDEGDGGTTTTNPTAAQLNAIIGVSGATVANQAAYQAYISANENNFSSPATAAEVQAMVTSVNAAQTLLAAIGTDENDGAATTTNPTAAQLNAIIGVSGATVANQAAYQAYISANENNFSSPATAAEVQAMVASVNAAQTLLAAIGTDENDGAATTTNPTSAQLNAIIGVSGATVANQAAYQAYINANENNFSSPATAAEVQAMITSVNAAQTLLAAIGTDENDGAATTTNPTAAQLNGIVGVSGATVANQAAYQAYINANENNFSNPATAAEVQTMVTRVNNQVVINNYATANTNPAPTVANYNAAGASAVNAGNLARVNTVVDSLTATDVNTLAKLQVVVNYAIKGAPGGVFLNNALWLKADAGVTTSGASDVDSWVGQSLKATSYSASTATGVAKNTLAASAINFNPAVRLAGGATPSLSATDVAYNNWIYYIVADPDNVTFASNFHGNNDLQLAYEAFNNTSKLGVTVRSAGTLPAKGDYVSTVDSPTVPAIMRYRHDSTSNNIDIESTANAVKQTGALNTNSTNRPLGVQQFGELFSGDIAEVFMLEVNAVTATETQRIESYLALKYGITLAQATNTNYLSSTGNMWVNDDDGYENDIVGIGKDINSALDQRIAKSVNSDAVLTISTDANFTGANNTHADNLDNGDFLVIANNHAATDATATQTTEINTSLTQNLRLVREWKADNVGSVGAVNLQFSGFNADWVLLSDTDGDFSNATVVGSLSATGTISTTLANNSYFTLARFDALVKIGADEDNTSTTSTITAAQINAISGVSGALAANEAAYRNYIDANDGNFDNPATAAQVQAMVTSVNAAQTLLAAIGTDENDGAATTTNPTAAQLNAITGVSGATVANQAAYQAYISANENNFSSPATAAEVQAMITSVNAAQTLLAAIGTDEGDGAATTTNPTAAQLNAIIGVSGATAANQAAYQAYINANENNFSSPATAAEVQAMITSVNAAQTLLTAIGADEGDGGTTTTNPTAAQLNAIIGVSGATAANQAAYQAYINANENNFSSPATAAEVQAMVTSVNAAQTLLAAIGTDEGDGGTTTTNPTAAQLNAIIGVSGATAANQAAYQAYISANENNFSSPATAAEIQTMVNSVNAAQTLLAAIGTDENDGAATTTNPTAAQLNAIIGVSGATVANQAAYQSYINANENNFSNPATAAEVQAMVTSVNAAQTLLTAIGADEGDGGTTTTNPTAAQLNDIIGVSGATVANQAAYQAYISANENNFSSPATAAEVQAMVTSVNAAQTLLAAIGTDENDGAATTTNPTAVQLNNIIGVSSATAANQAAYQAYINANENNFSSPATAAEVQAMVTSVNAAESLRSAIGVDEGDGAATTTNPTAAQLNGIVGVSGALAANQAAYQNYISANEGNFDNPATAAQIQSMVTRVNAAQSLLAAIGTDEGDGAATTTNATAAQLNDIIGVSGATVANQAAYQAYINANENNFSNPATAAEVQAMVTSVNNAVSTLAAIAAAEDSATTGSSVTAAQLNNIVGVSGATAANEAAYREYIDANEANFSTPATAAEVQAMVSSVNAARTLLAGIGTDEGDAAASSTNATAAQLNNIIGVSGALAANEAQYQAYINANDNNFDNPATAAQVQTMVTTVNLLVAIGSDENDAAAASTNPTAAQLNALKGVSGALAANESAYQNYINENLSRFSTPATTAEVQTMVDTVNLLGRIGSDEGDGAASSTNATAAQLNAIPGVSGALKVAEDAYQAYIDANGDNFSNPATIAQVQTMVTSVNGALAVLSAIGIDEDDGAATSTNATAAQLNNILGVSGAIAANEAAYQAYIDENAGRFSSPATQTEVQAMINSVNAAQVLLAAIGTDENDGAATTTSPTASQLNAITGVSGATVANQAAYQAYINANENNFDSPATAAQVQAMVTSVNAAQALLKAIGEDEDNGRPPLAGATSSNPTAAQLNNIVGVSGALAANEDVYQRFIDSNGNNFSSPATAAEVQAMVTTMNASQAVLTQVGNSADSPNAVASTLTIAQLGQIVPALTDVVAANQSAYQNYIDANPSRFSKPATAAEMQAMVLVVNGLVDASNAVLLQIGKEGDKPDTVDSSLSAAQLNIILPVLSNVIADNAVAYQNYIDANPDAFSAPATRDEVQAMINAVNTAVEVSNLVLAQVGSEGDNPDSTNAVVTVTQLQTVLPALTGLVSGNQSAYQDYIDANPDAFSAPATAKELQAMVDAVNASQTVLKQVGDEGDDPNTVKSLVSVAQLQRVSPALTGLISGNEKAYQAYIDANPAAFSSPATQAELQAMVSAVNASQTVLAQVGLEADPLDTVNAVVTVAQLQTITPAITGLVAGNQTLYQDYIDANPTAFSSPATAAEVQAMVGVVNGNVTASDAVLAQVGREGDSPDLVSAVVTVAQLRTVIPDVTGLVTANQAFYQAYIDANPDAFSNPATAAELQAMVARVNAEVIASKALQDQIGKSGSSPVTVAQLQTIRPAIKGLDAANESAYQAYIAANPSQFSEPVTAAELQAMVDAVNASQNVLAQIGSNNPSSTAPKVTLAQLQQVSPALTGLSAANLAAYQSYIDANPTAFSSPATAAELQAAVNAVNNSQAVLSQIGSEGSAGNFGGSKVTVAQLAQISPPINGLVAANEQAYQDYINNNPNALSDQATAAEIQMLVDVVNGLISASDAAIAQVGSDISSGNSAVTVAQLSMINPPLSGLDSANQAFYQDAINANPGQFSNPPTREEIQAMVNAVNAAATVSRAVLAQVGQSPVTAAQLATILPKLNGINAANQAAYQDYIAANPGLFSSPATAAQLQAMINTVNASQLVLAQVGNEGDDGDAVNSVVTTEQLQSVSGVNNVNDANESAYQDYIDANPGEVSSPATAPELQAVVDKVNTSQSVLRQVGSEADDARVVASQVTVAQLKTVTPSLNNIIDANQQAYRRYIDENPSEFSSPATNAQVQRMIDIVNGADSDGDGISDLIERGNDFNNNGIDDAEENNGTIETKGGGSAAWLLPLLLALLLLRQRRLSVALLLTLLASNVYAQDRSQGQGWYVGVGALYSRVAPNGESNNWLVENKHDNGYEVVIGARSSARTFVELKYADLGDADLINRNPAINKLYPEAKITYRTLSLAVGRYLQTQSAFKPYFKLGLSSADKKSLDDGGSANLEDQKLLLNGGVGVDYRQPGADWSLRLNGEMQGRDLGLVSVAFTYELF